MDTVSVRRLPITGRHFAMDERGVGLRATWHLDRGFVNLSLWADNRCVQTFHLTPLEAGRLVAFLAGGLADAVPDPPGPAPVVAVPASRKSLGRETEVAGMPGRLAGLRTELADVLVRAASRLR